MSVSVGPTLLNHCKPFMIFYVHGRLSCLTHNQVTLHIVQKAIMFLTLILNCIICSTPKIIYGTYLELLCPHISFKQILAF